MQNIVAILISACFFGGERHNSDNTKRVFQLDSVSDGDLCLSAAATKLPSRNSYLAKAKMGCQNRVPFLVAQEEARKV